MTGYLTQQGKESDGRYCLAIPNREIRNIITERILTLFRNEVKNDGKMAEKFCQALINQQPEKVEELLNAYLQKQSVSEILSYKNHLKKTSIMVSYLEF